MLALEHFSIVYRPTLRSEAREPGHVLTVGGNECVNRRTSAGSVTASRSTTAALPFMRAETASAEDVNPDRAADWSVELLRRVRQRLITLRLLQEFAPSWNGR